MDTSALKKFAPAARNQLIHQVRSRLDLVLGEESAARREHPKAVKDLQAAIAKHGKAQVVEQVAYTWFNRFTALRFMDANGYALVRVVSPAEGQSRPEILAEAAAGHVEDFVPARTREKVLALLDGRSPSRDPQSEAYRLLLVAACNHWHSAMPFLFERIDDYTELLLPEDLLSPSSLLGQLREVMTEDACQDVEIIGWLYQFYISEKKDQVFAGLKKNQKITAENIPAATQLFTPHWIVRYLVENSLGRLWLLNRPDSRLAERMDYYIAPEEPETDFLKITKPEEIRICDPACGSGHMLTYAFDLLHAIYEEEGYEATEIPGLILKHNLTGIEIDDRAGALAAFALAMKAAAKLGRRRFLRHIGKDGVQPSIVVLQNVSFTEDELLEVAALVGRDRFTNGLRETLGQFEQAKNFGSLIVPRLRDPADVARLVEARDPGGDLLRQEVQERALAVLRMTEALSSKYHVVVANPPYMGGKGIDSPLGAWLKRNYFDARSDLFSAFVVRCAKMAISSGRIGIMSPNVWMYISSHEKLRDFLIQENTLTNLVELPLTGFKGATVQISAYNYLNIYSPKSKGVFIRLVNFRGEDEEMASQTREAIRNPGCGYLFRVPPSGFRNIPGNPIAYWLGSYAIQKFANSQLLGEFADLKQGMSTTDSDRFVRGWQEVGLRLIAFGCGSAIEGNSKGAIWFPFN